MSTIEAVLAPPPAEASAPVEARLADPEEYGGSYVTLARWIHSDAFSRGDRAVLRRLSMDLSDVPPEVFWRAVGERVTGDEDEAFWRAILPLMATHPHLGERSLGEQLEGTRDRSLLPNSRLDRWLRLERDRAREDARRVLSRLDGGVNWADLGPLLHYWSPKQRKDVARGFFRARHRRHA